MGRNTEFEFGFNVHDNLGHWGQNAEAEKTQFQADRDRAAETESASVSELIEITCAQVKKMVHNITDTVKKANRMLPSSSGAGTEPRSRSNRQQSGLPFLKAENLTKQPKAAKILSVKLDLENKWGPCVSLKVALDGQSFMWTVKIKGNPNYAILERKFGNDENDWVGQPILLNLEQDEHTEQWFPRVSFPEQKAAKR